MKKIEVGVLKSKTKYPVVEVRWDDHFFDDSDFTLKDIIKEGKAPYKGCYVGYLVHENKNMLVLCSNVWDEGDLSCPMYVMKNCITYRSDE